MFKKREDKCAEGLVATTAETLLTGCGSKDQPWLLCLIGC